MSTATTEPVLDKKSTQNRNKGLSWVTIIFLFGFFAQVFPFSTVLSTILIQDKFLDPQIVWFVINDRNVPLGFLVSNFILYIGVAALLYVVLTMSCNMHLRKKRFAELFLLSQIPYLVFAVFSWHLYRGLVIPFESNGFNTLFFSLLSLPLVFVSSFILTLSLLRTSSSENNNLKHRKLLFFIITLIQQPIAIFALLVVLTLH